jgi:hypothetical protein
MVTSGGRSFSGKAGNGTRFGMPSVRHRESGEMVRVSGNPTPNAVVPVVHTLTVIPIVHTPAAERAAIVTSSGK